MHKHQTQASLITQKAVLSIDSSRLDVTPCNPTTCVPFSESQKANDDCTRYFTLSTSQRKLLLLTVGQLTGTLLFHRDVLLISPNSQNPCVPHPHLLFIAQ